MKLLFVILFLIALFHLCVYYCNIDLYAYVSKEKDKDPVINPFIDLEIDAGLTETKMQLEKDLNELKQYDSLNKHG